jgi:hypothetical protein
MKPLQNLSDDELSDRLRQALVGLPDAPVAWRAAATKLWPAATPAQTIKGLVQGLVNRINAFLTFDSWAMPAIAHGMRSVSSPTRHLLFSTEGRDIDLRISPDSDAFTLTGQILGPDEVGTIELSSSGENLSVGAIVSPSYACSLDALGEFRIVGLSRGTYVMTLNMGDDQIVIPGVEVGDRPK